MVDEPEELVAWIRRQAEAHNMTLDELAAASGVHAGHLRCVMGGVVDMALEKRALLADYFGVPRRRVAVLAPAIDLEKLESDEYEEPRVLDIYLSEGQTRLSEKDREQLRQILETLQRQSRQEARELLRGGVQEE